VRPWAPLALLSLLAAAPAAALTPVEKEVTPVVDLFYDLQFSSAAAAADALAARHPGHPAGPFYRSVVDYQRFLAEEPKSTATLAAFEAESERAVALADAWRSTSAAEGLYYEGVARGFRARVLAAQKRYFKALPEGLRAVKALKAALALDPGLEDAYLGLGMYEYFAARMPPAAKPFAYLVGAGWGDKEKGLADLRRAAEKGGPAKMEARSMLSSVYALEGRWPQAVALLRELADRYPRNPLYRLRLVYALERAGRWDEALAAADPAGPWLSRLPPGLRPVAEPPSRYRAAEIQLILGRPAEASALLLPLDAAKLPAGLADFTLVRRANVLDAQGERADAVRLYRSVRHREALKLAKGFLETPYPGGPKSVMPWLGLETPR
jgi:tetratricopeptide (TPR) repeat protein